MPVAISFFQRIAPKNLGEMQQFGAETPIGNYRIAKKMKAAGLQNDY